jgi:hypothetical protein
MPLNHKAVLRIAAADFDPTNPEYMKAMELCKDAYE